MGYIYLLHLYPSNPDKIYKLGRTSRDIIERFNEYKQNTTNPKMIFIYDIEDTQKAEKELKSIFKNKFTLRKDFGYEYFTGDVKNMKQTLMEYFMKFDKNEEKDTDEDTDDEEDEDEEEEEDEYFQKYEINTYENFLKTSYNIENIIITNKKTKEGLLKFKNSLWTKIWDENSTDKDAEILELFLEKNTDKPFSVVDGKIEEFDMNSRISYEAKYDFEKIVADILKQCYKKSLNLYKLKYHEYIIYNSHQCPVILDTKTFDITPYDEKISNEKILIDNESRRVLYLYDTKNINISIVEEIMASLINDKDILVQYKNLCYNVVVEQQDGIVFYDYSSEYCLLSAWLRSLLYSIVGFYGKKYAYYDDKKDILEIKNRKPRVVFINTIYYNNQQNLQRYSDAEIQKIIKQIQDIGVKNIVVIYNNNSKKSIYNRERYYSYRDRNKEKIKGYVSQQDDYFNIDAILNTTEIEDIFSSPSLLFNNYLKWCCKML